jgi:nucleoside 2-deoxyribosyltransferase
MQEADFIIAVLDGGTIDEGVAFEAGYMFALGKTCVALQTDVRRALPTGNNPMIGSSMTQIFQTVPDLVDWASSLQDYSDLTTSVMAAASATSCTTSPTIEGRRLMTSVKRA